MATTLTSLALTIAAEKAIVEATAYTAPLKAFSTGFKAAETQKGSTVKVPVFAQGAAGDFNKSTNNYANGTKGVTGAGITVDKHIVKSYGYDDIDFAECDVAFWEGVGIAGGRAIVKGILAKGLGLITATNFTSQTVMTTAQADSKKNWANLVAQADNADFDAAESVLLLNPTYFTALLAVLTVHQYGGPEAIRSGEIPGLYGFSSVIRCPGLPNADNLVGAIVHPTAIGVAGRLLQPQSAQAYTEVGYSSDDKSGLAIGWRRFGDPKTGENFIAYEALFGANVISNKPVIRIVSAAAAATPPEE